MPSAEANAVRPGRVLATVTAAQVLSVASASVVAVALPALARELDADGAEQQWVVDSFVLVFASLLIAGGVLGDRRGRRNALLAGLALFAAGSLWCALAADVGWLIAGRVVQALGPPLVLPASLAIVTATFRDPVQRARAVGYWGAGSGAGLALGPLLGGILVDGLGWRWVFGANVAVGALLIPLALRHVPRDRPSPPTHSFDAAAAVMVTTSVALLVFALIEGRRLGWTSTAILAALTAAIALAAAFVAHERRHPAPLVDLGLLRHRAFLAANLGGATLYGALTGLAVYFSVFFQQIQDRSALEAGLCLLPQGLMTAACAPLAGRVTGAVGPKPPILAGMGLVALAVLALARLEVDTPVSQFWWLFALLGMGTGIALPAMTVTALAAAPARRAGMASALHNASRQLGQTFGVAVLGTVILAHAGAAAEAGRIPAAGVPAWIGGLHVALLVAAACVALAGVVIAFLIPRPRPADR
jgi:DHA2 family methylenomycin A resistance protein-like MFS transporter